MACHAVSTRENENGELVCNMDVEIEIGNVTQRGLRQVGQKGTTLWVCLIWEMLTVSRWQRHAAGEWQPMAKHMTRDACQNRSWDRFLPRIFAALGVE